MRTDARSWSIIPIMLALFVCPGGPARGESFSYNPNPAYKTVQLSPPIQTPAIEIRPSTYGNTVANYGSVQAFKFLTNESASICNQYTPPGGRCDRFWGLLYNIDSASTGGVPADANEPYFGIRWEDFWWQIDPPGANDSGTVSGTPSYNAGPNETTITATANVFKQKHVGLKLIDTSTNNQYRVKSITSPTVCVVEGNASGESGAFKFCAGVVEYHHVFQRPNGAVQRFIALQLPIQYDWVVHEVTSDRYQIFDSVGAKVVDFNSEGSAAGAVDGTITGASYSSPNTSITVSEAQLHSGMINKSIRYLYNGTLYRFRITAVADATHCTVSGDASNGLNLPYRLVSAGSANFINMGITLDNSRALIGYQANGTSTVNMLQMDAANMILLGNNQLTVGVGLAQPVLWNGTDAATAIAIGAGNASKLVNSDAGVIKFCRATYNTSTTTTTLTTGNPHVAINTAAAGPAEIRMGTGLWAAQDVNIYRHAANILATDDDLAIRTAGKGLQVAEGSNAKMGTATLSGGAATVSTTAVTANSRIFLTSQSDGGTPGFLRVSARTAATSFTITSSSGSDTSVVAWMIVEPAP